jgi:hypothetical protein
MEASQGGDMEVRRKTMRRRAVGFALLFSVVCLGMGMYLVGCGGSGGGSGGVSGQSGTGTVSVLLGDGPADEYGEIWITVNEVSLIPLKGDPVVLFQSEQGYKVNLLEYRDEDFLLTVRRVPAWWYEKVRLRVSDVRAVGGPCHEMEIKLPSGKIDLNPRGPFRVAPGGTLSIRLDIDANKSIQVHPAGESGKCIFRPVVFVDIETGRLGRHCPQIVSGTIVELVYDEEEVKGFVLDLRGSRCELKVRITDVTVIWNEFGEPSDPDVLKEGQEVKVRAWLEPEGFLDASVVLIGDVLVFEGEVSGPVAGGVFPFTPEPGTGLLGDAEVEVLDETLILIGCDEPVASDLIQDGMRAKIFGWIFEEDGLSIRAAAVLLRPDEIAGEVVWLEPAAGGHVLTVLVEETVDEVDIFLPEGVGIFLEGDGALHVSALCEGRRVRVLLDPYVPLQPTATEIQVESEVIDGIVSDPDEDSRTLIVDGETVFVRWGATILDLETETPVSFTEIEAGDRLRIFGLSDCSGEKAFVAFVVLILEPPE